MEKLPKKFVLWCSFYGERENSMSSDAIKQLLGLEHSKLMLITHKKIFGFINLKSLSLKEKKSFVGS